MHQPGPDGRGARLDPRRVASAQTCPAGLHPQVEPGGCRRSLRIEEILLEFIRNLKISGIMFNIFYKYLAKFR